jgi:hypothetical protein
MRQLAQSATGIPAENVRQEVLDYGYVISYTTESGASVLVLLNDQVAPLVQEMFGEP